MIDRRNYSERLRDELQKEYGQLSRQRTGAWALVAVSGVLFVSNYFGVNEPTNGTLGGITLAGIVGGGIWLRHLHRELDRNARRSLEDKDSQQRVE
jgi:hypothetical protein